MRWCRHWTVVLLLLTGACARYNNTLPAPAPTFTLIPATATFTPTPLEPTPTSPPRLNPNDLAPTEPRLPTQPPSSEDPVAAEMIALAKERVVNEVEELAVADIAVLQVRLYLWQDGSLGCPLPDTIYTQVEIPGYRIVLEANEAEYIFHTSFTELVLCDPENELLPVTAD